MQKSKNPLNSKLIRKSYTLKEIIVYLVDIHSDLIVIAIMNNVKVVNISIFYQTLEKTYETENLLFSVVSGNSNFCQKVQ